MKITTLTMLMAAGTQAVMGTHLMAEGRGHGSFGVGNGGGGGGSHAPAMRVHAPQMMNGGGGGGGGMGIKSSGVMKSYTPPTMEMKPQVFTKTPHIARQGVTLNKPLVPSIQLQPRGTLGGKPALKRLDLGLGERPRIDPTFGRKPIDLKGKLTVIDPGFGKKPIDLGIGNGKPPVIDPGIGNGKKPIDLGLGKGFEKVKITPDIVDKIKFPGGPHKPPKIPICPPHPFPHKPPHWCHPCPPIFHGWCWFPGFNQCYGYVGGLALPPIVSGPMFVELPTSEMLVNGALPQIVPGTTVVATVTNAGSEMGRVMMQYNSVAMPAEVVKWEGDKVTFVVPAVALQQPVEVKLAFLRATGDLAHEVNAELVAATVEQQQ